MASGLGSGLAFWIRTKVLTPIRKRRRFRRAVYVWFWSLGTRRLESPPDVLVGSSGGSASTLLMQQLAQYIRINDVGNVDGLKHLKFPPTNVPAAILVTADPETAVNSLDRRGFLDLQLANFGRPLTLFRSKTAKKRTLEKDIVRQERRFSRLPNVLVVDYEEIWDRLPEIADFVGISSTKFVEHFPTREPRKTP